MVTERRSEEIADDDYDDYDGQRKQLNAMQSLAKDSVQHFDSHLSGKTNNATKDKQRVSIERYKFAIDDDCE